MCGLCGIYNYRTREPVDPDLLKNMCKQMVHRGPDDEGIYLSDELGFGHRRLSIIDLQGGHQPMHNEDQSIWIVFNGEIYNYKNLRNTLENRGHQFYTHCDTEVIIHAYEEYGEACVNQFEGMFAFGVWDKNKRKLFLARDRVGIKPLYFVHYQGRVLFASEIKALIQDPAIPRLLDNQALNHYLTFGYTSIQQTMFKNIEKLPPGHLLVCQDGKLHIRQYWDLQFHESEPRNDRFFFQRTKELLFDSVKNKLQSDVPLGAFLSGGLDSSTMVGVMNALGQQSIQTFSVGFDRKGYSELDYARLVANHFHTDHHEIVITAKDYEDFFPKFIWHQDEPLADAANIALYYVAKLARESVTVVLSGEGSDEAFAGYERYLGEKIALMVNQFPSLLKEKCMIPFAKRFQKSRRWGKALRCISQDSFMDRFISLRTHFTQSMKAQLFADDFQPLLSDRQYLEMALDSMNRQPQTNDLNKMQYMDTKLWLVEDMLMKKDKMGMAASIEARVPFLDHYLLEFAATLPLDLKIRGFSTKYILKKIMSNTLPKEIINRPKMGFPVPLDAWFRHELKNFAADTLLGSAAKNRGIFNPLFVQKLFDDHLANTRNNGFLLFQLVCFERWCGTFLDGA